MPLTERLRESGTHRQQRDIIIQRMKERHSAPLSLDIEQPQPASDSRCSKQWKFHFTVTITVPTLAVFTHGVRSRSRSMAGRSRRRDAQWKERLLSPLHSSADDQAKPKVSAPRAKEQHSPAASRHVATPAPKCKTKPRPENQRETSHQKSPRRKPATHSKTATHQSPTAGKPQRRGIMCPLCLNETVESRWKGREEWLRYAGVSARRCPRCLHRFYKEPLVLRPMHKLINVRNNVGVALPSRSKRK